MRIVSRWVLLVTMAWVNISAFGQGDPVYAWTNFTGLPGGQGTPDGDGANARFAYPEHLAVDAAGNVYIADSGNGALRKGTMVGTNLHVTTIAGAPRNSTGVDGTNSGASFGGPGSVAIDGAGNLYVADAWSHTIRKVTPVGPDWVVTTIAGSKGISGTADGTNDAARFYMPNGIAVGNAGDLFVADFLNHTIRKITPVGTNWVVTTIAGKAGTHGAYDAMNTNATFYKPSRLAIDASGGLFVADQYNNRIRKITPSGTNWVVSTVLWGFNWPTCVAVDATGNLFVADYSNYAIKKLTLVGASWVVSTVAGLVGTPGSADGTNSAARFYQAEGVAVAGDGTLYVADTWNHTIRRLSPAGTNWVVTTVAGVPDHSGTADGAPSEALFRQPSGLVADNTGNLLITDTGNHTVRRAALDGTVTTVAGKPTWRGGTDGTNTVARFYSPYGVTVDGTGNAFIADTVNSTIRRVTPEGVVTTIAGLYVQSGSADGAGTNARFNHPYGIAIDTAGALYVADSYNHTIRMAVASGTNWTVTTLAGSPGVAGTNDGLGSAARFNSPCGVVVDNTGVVFVADTSSHTIRQITAGGAVTTLAGSGGQSGDVDGSGSAARFNSPAALVVDTMGNLFVAESLGCVIRKVTSTGMVTTIGGRAGICSFAEGPGALAVFACPRGITIDSSGNLYVSDYYNNCIIKGMPLYPRISFERSDSAIRLSWPDNCLGWQLQAQTNLPGFGQSPSWTTVPGSRTTTQVTIGINSMSPSMFYWLSP